MTEKNELIRGDLIKVRKLARNPMIVRVVEIRNYDLDKVLDSLEIPSDGFNGIEFDHIAIDVLDSNGNEWTVFPRWVLEKLEMGLDSRINKAVADAEEAFWIEVANHFPEAECGDGIDAVLGQASMRLRVKCWVDFNTGLDPFKKGEE